MNMKLLVVLVLCFLPAKAYLQPAQILNIHAQGARQSSNGQRFGKHMSLLRDSRSFRLTMRTRFIRSLWKGITIPFPALRRAVLDENEEIPMNFRFRESLAALLLYLAVGAGFYHFIEPTWTIVDALYFTVTCFTTVGYGDLCPTTVGSKMFTCLFSISGICFLGAAVATLSSRVIEKEVQAIQIARKEAASKVMAIFEKDDKDVPPKKKDSVVLKNRRWKCMRILSRIVPPLALVLGGGVYIYNLNNPGPDPVVSWEALYYAIVSFLSSLFRT